MYNAFIVSMYWQAKHISLNSLRNAYSLSERYGVCVSAYLKVLEK